MRQLLRRIRGAVGMGLIWAVGWAGIGGLIEAISNVFPGLPLGFIDMWIQTLAIPGFLCGLGFAGVLRVTEGRRRFDQLSLPRFATWGAVGGLLAGGLTSMLLFGTAAFSTWLLRSAAVIGTTTLLSVASASGMLALARKAERRELRDASADVADAGLTEREIQELLGGKD